jgi:hypothetical protein
LRGAEDAVTDAATRLVGTGDFLHLAFRQFGKRTGRVMDGEASIRAWLEEAGIRAGVNEDMHDNVYGFQVWPTSLEGGR